MHPIRRPVIGFLTDFGLDGAAATCRAVMLSICPDAQIVDISHTVAKFAVRDGAYLLRAALPWFPVGVHVGVVDPGVGTERRPVAIGVGRGDVLVGPDNGLLLAAADALGGIASVHALENRELWLPHTTATFHGRDIFSPVAARLADGSASLNEVGPAVEPTDLVRLPEPIARADSGRLTTEITYVDSFGNLRLAGDVEVLRAAFGDEPADGTPLRVSVSGASPMPAVSATSFGRVPAGATLLYVDSVGNLALADNQADLARRIAARTGQPVTIERA